MATGCADEVVFSLDRLAPREVRDCFLYYAPQGKWRGDYRKETHARNGIDVSIGWESELIGYRSYYGKLDLFGKRIECLRLDNLGNYHRESDWGMDILHVGSSPGIGGLSLWDGDVIERAYNEEHAPPRCRIEQEVVADGPVRSVIRLTISGIKVNGQQYGLTTLANVYASQLYSEQRVRLQPATDKPSDEYPLLSVGIVRIDGARVLFDPAQGLMSSWGRQSREIGSIGLALIVNPDELVDQRTLRDSQELRLSWPASQEIRFFVAAEWGKAQADQRRLVGARARSGKNRRAGWPSGCIIRFSGSWLSWKHETQVRKVVCDYRQPLPFGNLESFPSAGGWRLHRAPGRRRGI